MTQRLRFGPHQFIARWNESLQISRTFARGIAATFVGLAMLSGCEPAKPGCPRCDLLVVAATGEPATLVPPLIGETVGRDISDNVFERLAYLKPGGVPSDTAAYTPGLATSWTQVDSVTWRFVLRPEAKWHDGSAVTSDDVTFSFAAYADTALGAPGGEALAGVTVTADGPGAVMIRFPKRGADELLDATYSVRILSKRIWDPTLRPAWGSDTTLAKLVGSGPFKVVEWRRGQSLRLERVVPVAGGVRQMVWRFTNDQDAALNLVLAGEADLLETAIGPAARDRASKDTSVVLRPYPSAIYGYLGFRHADAAGRPHPILADKGVRQALAAAIDRPSLVATVLGKDAAIPAGPMSRALWLWSDAAPVPADPARANQLLDSLGWARTGATRSKAGRQLAIDIMVPSTSGVRRQLAEGIQQMWQGIGVDATITAVDFPVFQQRLTQGKFDAMITASLDEPSPRSLIDQWTKTGWGGSNKVHYGNPTFDSLTTAAVSARTGEQSRQAWQAAIKAMTEDVAAVFLYSPTNVAVVTKRFASIPIDPFSWLSQAGAWRAP